MIRVVVALTLIVNLMPIFMNLMDSRSIWMPQRPGCVRLVMPSVLHSTFLLGAHLAFCICSWGHRFGRSSEASLGRFLCFDCNGFNSLCLHQWATNIMVEWFWTGFACPHQGLMVGRAIKWDGSFPTSRLYVLRFPSILPLIPNSSVPS